MEITKKNYIKSVSSKIGLINLIAYLFMFIPYMIIYQFLDMDSNTHWGSLKSIIVTSLPLYLSLFIPAVLIFGIDIKDIFSGKDTSFNLSIKAKIKLTTLFTSLFLFSSVISTYIMVFHIDNEVANVPFFTGRFLEVVCKLAYFGIMAPIMEEIINRGVVLKELKIGGSLFAIVTSTIIFTIPHSFGFLHAFVAGLILGLCYILSGNIRWSITFHIICNLGIVLITGWFEMFLPLINLNIVRLILGAILISIFFISTKNDDELKGLYKIINLKMIIDQIKIDKEKYKTFCTSPLIITVIVFGILKFFFNLI